jgi:hypothetical protein
MVSGVQGKVQNTSGAPTCNKVDAAGLVRWTDSRDLQIDRAADAVLVSPLGAVSDSSFL